MEMIDRKEAIGAVCRTECGLYCGHDCDVITALRNLPTIEERKKGRWVNGAEIPNKRKRIFSEDITYCSNCHNEAYWDAEYGQQLFDYCPYCGADMRGEENENQNN